MNILWIPNFFPFPANNGGKVVVSNRMIQVSKKHDIFLVVESEEIDETMKREILKICKQYTLVKPIERNKRYIIKEFLLSTLNVGRYRNVGITRAVEEYIKKYRIDLINIDLPMTFVNLYPIVNLINDIPVVINQQNIEFDCIRSKLRVKELDFRMKLYATIESSKLFKWEKKTYSCSAIKAFSFVSDLDIELFQKVFECKNKELFHSPIGTNVPDIDEKNFNNSMNEKKKIVFPAAFDYGPNVHGALWFVQSVMPMVRKSVDNVELYLVGKNPKEEVRALQCEDVIVTGTVDSMIPYMNFASLFVVPIFFGGGVKTKLIEMGCYAKPVVSTTVGCLGTLYKNNLEIKVADDATAFAKACIDALLYPEKWDSLRKAMLLKTYNNYLWDSIGNEYCAFLERTAQREEEC